MVIMILLVSENKDETEDEVEIEAEINKIAYLLSVSLKVNPTVIEAKDED